MKTLDTKAESQLSPTIITSTSSGNGFVKLHGEKKSRLYHLMQFISLSYCCLFGLTDPFWQQLKWHLQ